jgi:hypothetical protein
MRSWSARSSSDFGYEPAIPQCPNLHVVVIVAVDGVSAVECLVPRVLWMRSSVAIQPQPLVRNHPRVRRTSASATLVALTHMEAAAGRKYVTFLNARSSRSSTAAAHRTEFGMSTSELLGRQGLSRFSREPSRPRHKLEFAAATPRIRSADKSYTSWASCPLDGSRSISPAEGRTGLAPPFFEARPAFLVQSRPRRDRDGRRQPANRGKLDVAA